MSYEGALRDALALEERDRRQGTGRLRAAPAPRSPKAARARRAVSSTLILSPQ